MYVYGACCFYVCCSDCVVVCGNVCCVAAVVKDSVFFLPWSVEVILYVCVRDVMDVVFLFVLWSCRCSGMGSMSVSSCRCCMFVSCVHPIGSHEYLLLFTPSCCCDCFYHLWRLVCVYWHVVNVCAVCELWV